VQDVVLRFRLSGLRVGEQEHDQHGSEEEGLQPLQAQVEAQALQAQQASSSGLEHLTRMPNVPEKPRRFRPRRNRRGNGRALRARLTAPLRRLVTPDEEGGLVAHAAPVSLRQIFRRFWPFARPYRVWIAVGIVLLVVD